MIGLFSGGLALSSLAQSSLTLPSLAQSTLPPPPNVPVFPPSSPSPITPTPVVPRQPDFIPPPIDSTYPAPRVNSVQPISGPFRVVIDSASPLVLQQARFVQPDAFFQNVGGRRMIQAGLFTDEIKARQQISRFAARGLEARLSTGAPTNSGAIDTGYYAIVPGGAREVQEYRERAIRLGVTQSLLQLRDRPRGLHLAVGPFPNRREAEQVVQYLRDRGSLDARLFYDR
jgi:hypothetical protein